MEGKRFTAARRKQLCDSVAEQGELLVACREVGINHMTHYNWMRKDAEYAEAFRAAQDRFVDRLAGVAVSAAETAIREYRDGVEHEVVTETETVVDGKVVVLTKRTKERAPFPGHTVIRATNAYTKRMRDRQEIDATVSGALTLEQSIAAASAALEPTDGDEQDG